MVHKPLHTNLLIAHVWHPYCTSLVTNKNCGTRNGGRYHKNTMIWYMYTVINEACEMCVIVCKMCFIVYKLYIYGCWVYIVQFISVSWPNAHILHSWAIFMNYNKRCKPTMILCKWFHIFERFRIFVV